MSGLELQLFPDENEGYFENWIAPEPKVFVMWRMQDGRAMPMRASVSYAEGTRMFDSGESADGVAMPAEIHGWLADYLREHYQPREPGGERATASARAARGGPMPNEGFLQRWSRLKAEPAAPEAPAPVAAAPVAEAPLASAPDEAPALPTLADAAALDAGSDYSAFVGRGVDSAVRRLAMKKLFADPHFNLIDGLDIYMGDYNLPDPVSAGDARRR